MKALILTVLILGTTLVAYGQRAPICDNQCAPDPSSLSYQSNTGSRAKLNNARGQSNRRAPRLAISSSPAARASNLIGMAEAMPGSQSYNWAQPLVSLSGRAGLDVNLVLHYNSRVWDVNTDNSTITFNTDRDFPSYGFRLDYGFLEHDTNGFWILTESDGGKHQLNQRPSTTTFWDSTDSSYIQLDTSTATNPVVTYANGLQVKYEKFASQGSSPTLFRPIQITDTNGNYISIAYVSASPANVTTDQQISTITDTLGRVLSFNYNSSKQLISITQGTYTHATFTWRGIFLNYQFSSPLSVTSDTPANGTWVQVLSTCTLPNGTFYRFNYGDWGIANKIEYFSNIGNLRSYESYNFSSAYSALSDVPGYSRQTISPDGTIQYFWDYSTTTSGDIVSAQTITDPTGTVTTLNLLANNDPCAGAVSSSTISYGGTTLRSIANTWQQDTAGNCHIMAVKTTLNDSGQVSESDFQYDAASGNITDQKDYDFGAGMIGPKLREIQTGYLPPTANHILNLVTSIVVGDTTATRSQTIFAYDGSQLSALTSGVLVQNSQPPSGTPRGNLTAITRYTNAQAPSGGITRNFTYDVAGNLVTAQLDCCNQKTWNYSSTTQWAYPDSVTRGSGASALTTSATYNLESGSVATATDENNQITRFSYDAYRRLYQTTLPNSTVLQTTYNDMAAQPSVTSGNSFNSLVQITTLDGLGRAVKQQSTNSGTVVSTVETAYDGLGRVTSVSNPYAPGETPVYTTTTYDHLNRATQVSPPSAGSYQYSYLGNSTLTQDPAGKQIARFGDALGRLIEVDEPMLGALPGRGSITISGSEQSYTDYICISWRESPIGGGDPVCDGYETEYLYDYGTVSITVNGHTNNASYGQSSTPTSIATALVSAINGDSAAYVTASSSGATVSLTSKATGTSSNYSLSTSVTFDSADFSSASFTATRSGPTLTGGSVPSVSLRTPAITTYSYRPTGELTQVLSGAQTRTYVYDDLGRVTQTTLPESGTWNYTYYDFGGVNTRTDARGVVTTYAYDGLNRLQQISYNVGSTGVQNPGNVTFNYGSSAASSNNGRLTSMTDGTGSEAYTYNNIGWVTNLAKVISGTTYNIGYDYNALGQLKQITYPSGRQVVQGYDSLGRLSAVVNNGNNTLVINNYDAAGQVLGVTYGNGVIGAFTYNDHLQLATLSYTSGSTALLNLTYGYGTQNNGQIASITDSRGDAFSEQFTYDALGRIIQGQTKNLTAANTWCLSWGYDRYGNRLSQSGCGGNLTVGQPNLSINPTTNRIQDAPYHYDANGNMDVDPNHTYKYDADNRMVTVDAGSASPHSYTYDANRLRVIKDSTVYIYSGTKVIAEYSGGSLQKEYVYSGGKLLATVTGSSTMYHHPDHLSNRLETDGSGNVTRTFGSLPFGDPWYETGTTDKWKFTTYERDSETFLDYAINRHYASSLGRFTAPDLMGGNTAAPQSLNRYLYSRNDPINMTDPLGLLTVCLGNFHSDDGGKTWTLTDVIACWDDGGDRGELDPDTRQAGGGGAGGSISARYTVNLAVLNNCIHTALGLTDVTATSMTVAAAGGDGSTAATSPNNFNGQGSTGPINVSFDAHTYTSKGLSDMTNTNQTVFGYTPPNNPFGTLGNNNNNAFGTVLTQVHELGHALWQIATGSTSNQPGGEAGRTLEDCVKNNHGIQRSH